MKATGFAVIQIAETSTSPVGFHVTDVTKRNRTQEKPLKRNLGQKSGNRRRKSLAVCSMLTIGNATNVRMSTGPGVKRAMFAMRRNSVKYVQVSYFRVYLRGTRLFCTGLSNTRAVLLYLYSVSIVLANLKDSYKIGMILGGSAHRIWGRLQ